MYMGGRGDGPGWASMLDDLADLFEQAAANRTPIRVIVGDDPAEFVDAFVQNYPEGSWITRERDRLNSAIARAAGEDGGNRRRFPMTMQPSRQSMCRAWRSRTGR